MKKKNILFVFIAIVLLVGFGLYLINTQSSEVKKVKVGVILPMTGNAADYGNVFWNGSKAALEKLGDDSRLELILEDSKGDPKVAISVTQKLINYDGAEVILGALSPVMLAITPIAERSQVVVLNPVANSPKLSGISNYLFNTTPLSNEEAEFLADLAYKRYNKTKAAVLYINNESGLGFRDNFSETFEKLGGKIVYEEAIPLGETGLRQIVLKLKKANPDVVFLATYYRESALILKQSKELQYTTPLWLTYSAIETPEFLKLVSGAGDGVIYSYSGFNRTAKNAKEFVEIYKRLFGKEPDIWSGQFYEAVVLLNDVLKRVQATDNIGTDIINILSSNKFDGLSGEIGFDKNHSVKGRFLLKTIKNNSFVFEKN